ncbi:MAG: hypothetical protein DME08_13515 [Candidatus Rokuibacteriota bacterium]|nr:MAG: hypothetical protein DME08_13515 [Candidatus Rokubacteria bacterium]
MISEVNDRWPSKAGLWIVLAWVASSLIENGGLTLAIGEFSSHTGERSKSRAPLTSLMKSWTRLESSRRSSERRPSDRRSSALAVCASPSRLSAAASAPAARTKSRRFTGVCWFVALESRMTILRGGEWLRRGL